MVLMIFCKGHKSCQKNLSLTSLCTLYFSTICRSWPLTWSNGWTTTRSRSEANFRQNFESWSWSSSWWTWCISSWTLKIISFELKLSEGPLKWVKLHSIISLKPSFFELKISWNSMIICFQRYMVIGDWPHIIENRDYRWISWYFRHEEGGLE